MSKIGKKTTNNSRNFWDYLKRLKKPIFVMAPMANVTDVAFRSMFAKYGKPDVMFTEFVSADGLLSPGRDVLLKDLAYEENQRPIIAQIFSGNPEKIFETAKLVKSLGFDGLDINMGCPDRAVEKQGAGAGHIKNPGMAKKVIEAAREGAPGLPVSVKTRLGYNKVDFEWIKFLLEQRLPAITFHLRTRKEMSDVPAHWELMSEIVKMRDQISPETLILGNGDVESMEEAHRRVEETHCDGVMIGRGIFGNPWFFSSKVPTIAERLNALVEHTNLFEKNLGQIKNFAVMKKHFKAYVSGWDGARELRIKLMDTVDASGVEKIVEDYLKMLN